MRFNLSRTKNLWLVALFIILVFGILVTLSGCIASYSAQPSPTPYEQPIKNPVQEPVTVEKDYTGVAVSGLPIEEQIKIARCVELSSIVNWGEGGPMYRKEVAQAFMLDYPHPDFLTQLEEEFGRYEPQFPAIAFLAQHVEDSYYWREIWFYTGSDTIQIHLVIDSDMNVVRSRAVRMIQEYPWAVPYELHANIEPEFDLEEAIRDHVDWLLQTPISYEEAVKILGGSPRGGLLCFDMAVDPPWFKPLEKKYYSYDAVTGTPDPNDFLEVIQVWYKPNTSTVQYIVIRQTSAEAYRSIFPSEKDGISFFPNFIAYLDDDTPVGVLFLGATPYTPEWLQYKWFAEWISSDVRHSVIGINLSAGDLLRVIGEISGQWVKRAP